MAAESVRTQASAWDDALKTGKEHLVLDLDKLVFDLPYSSDRLKKLDNNKDKEDVDIDTKEQRVLPS